MYLLGIDLGSSSVKAAVLEAGSGGCVRSAFYPKTEMPILSPGPGMAEQDPALWWENACLAVREAMSGLSAGAVRAIGISYQMHGLVAVDAAGRPLRPAIIWCDSRAVEIGRRAFAELGEERCLAQLHNSPGNFTASKLAWVREHEPELFARIHKILLPGDYIAYLMTGKMATTLPGLSEGVFWDFAAGEVAGFLLEHFGIPESLLAGRVPTFGAQGELTTDAAAALGLAPGTPVTYRAGDQPNNALALGVLEPGEVAATAGTSGVVYGVSERVKVDPQSRINIFAHVNYTPEQPRLGSLLCINGTGILNAWLRRMLGGAIDYAEMDRLAASVTIGADGLTILPFGNGAERMLGNRNPGGFFCGLDFNRHGPGHLCRAAQEGIVFAFHYGMEILRQGGTTPALIRAGHANMFLSPLFREALATISGATVELLDTDGALGAARGAGVGLGIYKSPAEAFASMRIIETVRPNAERQADLNAAYGRWQDCLARVLQEPERD